MISSVCLSDSTDNSLGLGVFYCRVSYRFFDSLKIVWLPFNIYSVKTLCFGGKIKTFIFLALIIYLISSTFASDWSSTNVQILWGNSYQLGERHRTILTFEHADRWDLGDNYFFFDTTHPDTEETKIYGEYSPSISFGKILKKDLSFGLIKDYRLTATIEMGNGSICL